MVKMKFEGGAELAKAFEQLSARVAKRTLRESLENAAEPIRRTISQLAPRDPDPIDLRDNIVISIARASGVPDGIQAASVAVGPAKGFFYAYFNEFGTVHQPARPFIRPAFDGGVTRAISEIGRSMWTALAARGISRSTTSDAPIQSDGRFL